MIRGEDVDAFDERFGKMLLADGDDLSGNIFQAAETAERLGKCI
jgi:hypothetical protein